MINQKNLEKLIIAAFSDEGFGFFCYDYFKDAFDQFSGGMTYPQKVAILVNYCAENQQLEELLMKLKEANPSKFAQLEATLHA